MAELTASSLPRARRFELSVLLVPIVCAIVGLIVRYLAFASVVPDASFATFANGLCKWDCDWYVRLAEGGYDPFPVPSMINSGNWAFFPLYPMLIGGLRLLTGQTTIVIATIVSILLSGVAAMAARPLLGGSQRAYILFSAFLLCGPFSIYFTTFYTEVLFLLLTVCTFVAVKRRNYLLAGVFAALVSATRIVGVFIVFAIVIEAWLEHRERGGRLVDFVPAALRRPDLVLAVFIAPLGLFCYMAYLQFHIGDGLAFSHVQRAWARPSGNPLMFVWQALNTGEAGTWVPSASQQLGVATLVGFALIGVMVVRRQFAMAVFSAIALVVPLFAGMASMLRFVTGLAPVPITLVTLLARSRWSFVLALLVFVVGGYFCTIGWLTEALALV
ncbi:MAG: hypothetical protein JWR75_1069 [Devosia sp.]|nr:hypothetical protein [Devosia sp.]